jgi:uncharacterized repeat protein (TIGR01451 family)
MKIWVALLSLVAPTALFAAGADHVALTSHVFVEHSKPGPNGQPALVKEDAKKVAPGDRLVFELSYKNVGPEPATGFVITDPLPASVAFAGDETAGATFSVDGGRTWGPLASLRVALPNGASRPAGLSDVTHIRWEFARPIPGGAAGSVTFRGVVK